MFRVFLVVFVAVVLAGGVALSTGMLDEWLDPTAPVAHPDQGPKVEVELGDLLYAARETPPLAKSSRPAVAQLVVDPCYVVVRDKQEVSSQKDGKLLFVGQIVTADSPRESLPRQKLWPHSMVIGKEIRLLQQCPWEEGDRVDLGQLLGVVDPALAIIEAQAKAAKVQLAVDDLDAAKRVYEQWKKKLDKLEFLQARAVNAVSELDLIDARVGVAKYEGEMQTKKSAIAVAKAEEAQAVTAESQHFLKNELPGPSRIKKIYKLPGEGLKAQEPVLQLWSINRLKIEGSVDSQLYAVLRTHKEAQCYLEPSVEIAPTKEHLKAHLGEVTSVAVCSDGEHFVSGSVDHTVCVWRQGQYNPQMTLRHQSPVRVVACSPVGAILAVGCADGKIILYDLMDKEHQPLVCKDEHRGPVTALAFSPDGNYLVSGGEDTAIFLWNPASGTMLYPFDAAHGVDDPHRGVITALQFTPQCKLVSAARDNTVRVWSLHKEGARLLGEPIANRGGTVGNLGVSNDGRYMLFDKGRSLYLLNVADGSTISVLDNLGGGSPFDTMALFSPDGNLMLTGGAGEGRLHLWKTPTPEDRGYQVRELVVKDRSAINAAAFGPAGKRFAVTGNVEGLVQFWDLPGEAEVNNHRIFVDADNQPLRLDLVEQALESNKARVVVNVLNPQERLVPGQRVTLVVVLPLAVK
jgi:WD40 repeat protein